MFFWILVLFFVSSLAVACSSSKKTSSTAVTISATDSTTGLSIIKGNDCITCHSLDKKLIGPSFLNIATRYNADQNTIDRLANKIIKGGKGSWGDLPMTPHRSLSKDDAMTISKYILSLKRQL